MILANINYTRVDQRYLFDGKHGKYLDLVLFDNRDGKDQHGNDGIVMQGLPKDARDRGEKGVILGNFKRMEARTGGAPRQAPAPARPLPPPRADGTRY